MAIEYGDGKAGQYAKSQAQKQIERAWSIIVLVGTIPMLLIGICVGFMLAYWLALHFAWARRISYSNLLWLPTAALAVLLSALVLSIRVLRRPLNYLMRERLKWLRGGQAEALIVMLLRDLDDDWHLFNNVKLKTGGDLDHVLIGPGGVFCISTKSIKGTYSMSPDGSYLLNGNITDQLVESKTLALKLRNWLEVKLHDSSQVRKVPWVQPVLAAPFARVEFASQQQSAWVTDDDVLMQTLRDHPRRLNATTIAECVQVLQEITHRAPRSLLHQSSKVVAE